MVVKGLDTDASASTDACTRIDTASFPAHLLSQRRATKKLSDSLSQSTAIATTKIEAAPQCGLDNRNAPRKSTSTSLYMTNQQCHACVASSAALQSLRAQHPYSHACVD